MSHAMLDGVEEKLLKISLKELDSSMMTPSENSLVWQIITTENQSTTDIFNEFEKIVK